MMGRVVHGAGGASKAFQAFGERRISELADLVGYRPHPGTLNLRLDVPFNFDGPHVQGEIMERARRGKHWRPTGVRLYPVTVDDIQGHVIRFDGARYPDTYVGVIAPVRLRDHVGETVEIKT